MSHLQMQSSRTYQFDKKIIAWLSKIDKEKSEFLKSLKKNTIDLSFTNSQNWRQTTDLFITSSD